jgi:hypothetical protein
MPAKAEIRFSVREGENPIFRHFRKGENPFFRLRR